MSLMTCETVPGVFESVSLLYGSAWDRSFYIVFSSRFLPRFACSNPSNTPSYLVYMHYVSRNTVHLSVRATRRMRGHAVADTENGSKLHSWKLQIMIHRVDSCRPDLRSSLTYHGKPNRAFERSRISKKGARGLSPGEMHHQLATSTGCLHKEAKPTPGLLQCLPCL